MTEGLDRFAQLKTEVAKTYNLDPDSPRCKMLAGLFLSHERMIEAMADGRHTDYGAFSRICDLLDKYTPPVIPKVEIEIVPSVPTTETPAGDALKPADETSATHEPDASAAASTEPADNKPLWHDDGFVPHQDLRRGNEGWVKQNNEVWRPFVGRECPESSLHDTLNPHPHYILREPNGGSK